MTIKPHDGPVYERLRAVREAMGLTQLQFLPKLNAAALKLGVREYQQSTLSRLETGNQTVTFDDVAVYALVDPRRPGKLWLGWGEIDDSSLARTQGPSVIRPVPADLEHRPVGKRPAAKRKGTG